MKIRSPSRHSSLPAHRLPRHFAALGGLYAEHPVRHGLRLALVGALLGLAIAYLAAPYIQDLLFQVSPRDPAVLATVVLTLLAVSLAASLAPGLRATRVDPVAALKSD